MANITIDDGYIVDEDNCIAWPCHLITLVRVLPDDVGPFRVVIGVPGTSVTVAEGFATREEACEELQDVLQTLRRECH